MVLLITYWGVLAQINYCIGGFDKTFPQQGCIFIIWNIFDTSATVHPEEMQFVKSLLKSDLPGEIYITPGVALHVTAYKSSLPSASSRQINLWPLQEFMAGNGRH